MAEIKLVRMCKSEPDKPGELATADVHPDEVQNWKAVGWEVAFAVSESVNEPEINNGEPDPPVKKAGRRSRK